MDTGGTYGKWIIGSFYFTATAGNFYSLWYVQNQGNVSNHQQGYMNFGIRPVVTLTSGVYISSGSGIEEDPYILAKE